MNLAQYYNKTVNIISTDEMGFFGKVSDYVYPEDNETGKESIIIYTANGDYIEFDEDDIKTITVI